jgi:Zn-dependent M28 family amino/carboxypeptidase
MDGEQVAARANVFCRPCDVAASTVGVCTLAELEAAELSGRIAILHGDLTREGLSARNGIYYPERHRQILALLEEKAPAAIVTVNPRVNCYERIIVDGELDIPSATVPAEAGLALLRRPDAALRLRIDSHRAPGQAHNVLARKGGARPARVVLCAHLDTKIGTPGAFDNASGVALLLALAETWAEQDLALSLEWVAFNGEEMGGLGDVVYWQQGADEAGSMLAAINVDGAGQFLGANSIVAMACSQAFEQHVAALLRRYPGVQWTDPWWASNHGAFVGRGIPTVAITASGPANVGHLPADTVEWISPAKLGEVLSLVADVVESLHDKQIAWCRKTEGGQ